jgi:hypothetical protein
MVKAKRKMTIINNIQMYSLVIVCFLLGLNAPAQSDNKNSIRGLYTYDFGGLEKMEVQSIVETLTDLNYAGIVVNGRGESALKRLDKYLELNENNGGDFKVYAAYLAHRFDKYGFSDTDHRTAIDRIAGKGIDLWVWCKDNKQDGSVTDEKVAYWIKGIVEYAATKNVNIILYSHYNTYYQTALDALEIVKKINSPNLGLSINLSHELRSDKGPILEETFERSKNHISTIIISGSNIELDRTSPSTMNTSTVMSLEKSEYDLIPFMKLTKKYGSGVPLGFINFKMTEDPKIYLKNTMDRWIELCNEVGLYEN